MLQIYDAKLALTVLQLKAYTIDTFRGFRLSPEDVLPTPFGRVLFSTAPLESP